MKVSGWITENDFWAYRVILDEDFELHKTFDTSIKNRVCVIVKTPKVRLYAKVGFAYTNFGISTDHEGSSYRASEYDAWIEGAKGSDALDEDSRNWCDSLLECLGYELTNIIPRLKEKENNNENQT